MNLNKKAFGLTSGILWGLTVFLTTIILLIQGSGGEMISRLANVYFGYSYSYLGSIIGLVWGFVTGFIGGWIFAAFYNQFTKTS